MSCTPRSIFGLTSDWFNTCSTTQDLAPSTQGTSPEQALSILEKHQNYPTYELSPDLLNRWVHAGLTMNLRGRISPEQLLKNSELFSHYTPSIKDHGRWNLPCGQHVQLYEIDIDSCEKKIKLWIGEWLDAKNITTVWCDEAPNRCDLEIEENLGQISTAIEKIKNLTNQTNRTQGAFNKFREEFRKLNSTFELKEVAAEPLDKQLPHGFFQLYRGPVKIQDVNMPRDSKRKWRWNNCGETAEFRIADYGLKISRFTIIANDRKSRPPMRGLLWLYNLVPSTGSKDPNEMISGIWCQTLQKVQARKKASEEPSASTSENSADPSRFTGTKRSFSSLNERSLSPQHPTNWFFCDESNSPPFW